MHCAEYRAMNSSFLRLTAVVNLSLLLTSAVYATPLAPPPDALALNRNDIQQSRVGDLPGMYDRRVIRVLTTYSKTFFFIDKGTQRGLTHDIFIEFERNLNKRLAKEDKLTHRHLRVRILFVPVTREHLFTALNDGMGDIAAANLTVTPAREALVAFTDPIYPNAKELLLSGPSAPQIDNLEQLSGKTVFVRFSSSYYDSLVTLNTHFVKESRPPVILEPAPESLEDEDLIEMLNAGLIPFIVVDQHKATFWKQVFPKIKIHDNIVLRDHAQIAWAVRKDSPQLLALLNNFVKGNKVGSTLGNTLFLRYLKNAKYVKDATSEEGRRKFLMMVELFRKYGKRYNVDWLLMAAQGYQESRLNQSVRSPVGAIGVMQVMPSTGKQLDVGDIRKLEPNIHAGVKYMRWMIDQYYGDEPMTPLNKALFSFASYNAGPARIARLQAETKKRGFDPDVWFGNVENLAAEKIGAETVNYVSNIYKYYVAYRLVLDEIAQKEKAVNQSKAESAAEKSNAEDVPVKP
jgi:membrane-bound lytic murein transglycosylase MltF